MSKQRKEKQTPVLGRLLEYAGGHKRLSVLGCGLSGVSAAVGIFPFVFVSLSLSLYLQCVFRTGKSFPASGQNKVFSCSANSLSLISPRGS